MLYLLLGLYCSGALFMAGTFSVIAKALLQKEIVTHAPLLLLLTTLISILVWPVSLYRLFQKDRAEDDDGFGAFLLSAPIQPASYDSDDFDAIDDPIPPPALDGDYDGIMRELLSFRKVVEGVEDSYQERLSELWYKMSEAEQDKYEATAAAPSTAVPVTLFETPNASCRTTIKNTPDGVQMLTLAPDGHCVSVVFPAANALTAGELLIANARAWKP